MVAKYLLYGN